MKSIEDMTHEEIVALTDTDIEKMVRRRCAEEGVRLPGPEPVRPTTPDVEKDVVVYKVGPHIHVTYRAVADELAAALEKAAPYTVSLDYDYNRGGYDYQYVTPKPPYSTEAFAEVAPVRVMSRDSFLRCIAVLGSYKTELKDFEKVHADWKADVEAVAKIREDIMSMVDDAHRRERELERAESKFAEYVEIADGDRELAKRFFYKAQVPSFWVRDRLFPEDAPHDPTARRESQE